MFRGNREREPRSIAAGPRNFNPCDDAVDSSERRARFVTIVLMDRVAETAPPRLNATLLSIDYRLREGVAGSCFGHLARAFRAR